MVPDGNVDLDKVMMSSRNGQSAYEKTLNIISHSGNANQNYTEVTGSFLGLMVDSGRAHAKEYFPELGLPVSLSLR